MPNRSLPIERVLTLLAETPLRIAALTAGLEPAQLLTILNPGEWSANDVLAHLRSCADVWGNCIKVIITQDTPIIRGLGSIARIVSNGNFSPRCTPLPRSVPIYWQFWNRCRAKAGHVRQRLPGRESHSYRPCILMLRGWLAMNGRTSSRSNASSTRCACSSDHRLNRRPDNSIGMKQGETRWKKSIYIRA